MKNSIRLQDAMKIMEATDRDGYQIPFSIVFTTCDLSRDTGGDRIYISEAVLASTKTVKNDSAESGIRATLGRNPAHWRNYTRNIRAVGKSEIKSIHPLLIDRINDQRVIL